MKLCGQCENNKTCEKYKLYGAMSNRAEKCDGFTEKLKHCPHCGKEVEIHIKHSEAYIICSDHNCMGMMQIQWGTLDDNNIFIQRLKDNWNKRV